MRSWPPSMGLERLVREGLRQAAREQRRPGEPGEQAIDTSSLSLDQRLALLEELNALSPFSSDASQVRMRGGLFEL